MRGRRWLLLARHWSVALTVVGVAFLLASVLVIRLSTTLTQGADQEVATGEVALSASGYAQQGPVFQAILEPGQAVQSCIEIRSSTDGIQRGVTFDLDRDQAVSNPLAQRLQLTVERGAGTFATSTGDGSCRGFRSQRLVLSDSLADVLATEAVPVWRPPAGEASTHFRLTARLSSAIGNELQDIEVDGIELAWVATADTPANIWIDEYGLLFTSLARDRLLPLVGLALLAATFVSLQGLLAGRGRRRESGLPDERAFEPPSLA